MFQAHDLRYGVSWECSTLLFVQPSTSLAENGTGLGQVGGEKGVFCGQPLTGSLRSRGNCATAGQ